MGKLAKPQRSKKQKKIKSVDPFYKGDRKDRLYQGLNQKPKSTLQEIPKKLQRLGFMIDDVKSGKHGKKSRNKFQCSPDAPIKFNKTFSTPLGDEKRDTTKHMSKKKFAKKIKADPTMELPEDSQRKDKKVKKKGLKLKTEDVEEYIDNLKPVNSFVGDAQFKRKKGESEAAFMRRVNTETNSVLVKAKMAEKYEVSDAKKIAMMVKAKKSKMNEKKKLRLSEKKKRKQEVVKEKKRDKLSDFRDLDDKVEFGEVVHAPPVLMTRPKKAVVVDHDKPGLRMPELSEAIKKNMQEASAIGTLTPLAPRALGQTRKRKHLTTGQQQLEDDRREDFVEAYRQLKKAKLKAK